MSGFWFSEGDFGMKYGKVSEAVYKRSILKFMEVVRQEGDQITGIGVDACVHRPLGGVCPVTSSGMVTMVRKRIGVIAFYRAINCLAAMGAVGRSVLVNFLVPDWFMETDLRRVMEELYCAAAELEVSVAGVYVETVRGMEFPVMMVSAYGEVGQEDWVTPKRIEAGMDLVMTKEAGTEGAGILAFEREEELWKRFTLSFVDQVQGLLSNISAVGEAAVAVRHGVKAMHSIGEGGVFGALWEIAEAAGLGLEADLKKIPIRQETIEICELFHRNPYQISSTGSLLMVAEDGYHLAEELEREGFRAAVIGRITSGKDRVLLQDGEKRFLEPPKMDELIKGLMEKRIGG